MFDNRNPYTLRHEVVGGFVRYYVSFVDGAGVRRETQISRQIYAEFRRFKKNERNLRRWDERYVEQSELTEMELHNRAFFPDKTVEETVIESLQIRQLCAALQKLSTIQRRRLFLRYELRLTFEEIAEKEHCKRQAIQQCLSRTEKEIKANCKQFVNWR